MAAEIWDLKIDPPLREDDLVDLAHGTFTFRAKRPVTIEGVEADVLLEVSERWASGHDPLEDRRLEAEGCYLEVGKWLIQVESGGDLGAERLDVIPQPDDLHPRVHRHPYGRPNDTRVVVHDLPVPDAWLSSVDTALGGALNDSDLADWEALPEEDEAEQVD